MQATTATFWAFIVDHHRQYLTDKKKIDGLHNLQFVKMTSSTIEINMGQSASSAFKPYVAIQTILAFTPLIFDDNHEFLWSILKYKNK